ncbi:MAG: carbohydrate kinase [Promethearchaeota archaeon]|nr:MAG: carbohydrate kinase [Candidatus Lokiarchaeota archaeon]
MSDYFLGLDCSTQGLTAIVLDKKSIVYTTQIIFDIDLPHYHTKNGVLISEDGRVVHSPPLMWIEALELIFQRIKDKISIVNIKAISGSGQQHGTVYLNEEFAKRFNNLHQEQELVNQFKGCFSRKTSPIWMDSSTSQQCEEIRNSLGGMKQTINITGSNTFERFSGPQIRKFYQQDPEKYKETAIIHLVSSFMASVLMGKNAPIDHGDGAGMNLMNIRTKKWDDRALKATAPNLKQKLPSLIDSQDIIGKISPYFVKKFDFHPDTILTPWSGDNPNSLVGVGLIDKGSVAISLGTSDTYFAYLKNLFLDFNGEGHVFGAPTGDYMSLICYKNGSLARERIKDSFSLDWDEFSDILSKTRPGNEGRIMLPYFLPEIVPLVLKPRVYRFGFNKTNVAANVRAIIESQFLSMRLHSKWIEEKPKIIYATGGASANAEILQIASDIFQIEIQKFNITESAALGAAMRSMKAHYEYHEQEKSWHEIMKIFLEPLKEAIFIPDSRLKELYDDMIVLYEKYEDFILQDAKDPESYRLKFIQKYFSN